MPSERPQAGLCLAPGHVSDWPDWFAGW